MNPPAAAMREPETLPQSRAEHDRMANAIRALAMDAVEQAKSGHPGLPMGAADIATVLFTQFLKFDPADPQWPDRDRFVLSAGHGSMLLYALLYLTGYEAMTIDQIKRFRQLGSNTPGHPENFETAGVETTKSGRWCSPTPNTSSPISSASTISSSRSAIRCSTVSAGSVRSPNV